MDKDRNRKVESPSTKTSENRYPGFPETPEEEKELYSQLERAFLDPWPDSEEQIARSEAWLRKNGFLPPMT